MVVVEGVDLGKLVQRIYGGSGWTFQRMKAGWMDLSFLARNSHGEEYTFKIFKDVITSELAQIEAEIAMINYLNTKNMPIPAVVPTKIGEMYGQEEFDGITRRFRLSTFIKGDIVDVDYNVELCEQLGRIAGLMDVHLSEFHHDFYESRDQSDILMKFTDFETRKLIEELPERDKQIAKRYLQVYDEKVKAKEMILPKQICHADMHGRNLIMNDDRTELVGVIDFSDAMLAFRIHDPSVALCGIMLGKLNHISCARAFMENYCKVIKLTEAELQALPVTVAGRMAQIQSIINFLEKSQPGYDEDGYYKVLYAPTWNIVDRLIDPSKDLAIFFNDFAKNVLKSQ